MHFSVVVPWRSDDGIRAEIFEWITERWKILYPYEIEFIVCDSGDEPFSRSKSRNQGAKNASTDVLVFADADTIPVRRFIDKSVESASLSRWCIAYDMGRYYNLNSVHTRELLRADPATLICEPVEGMWDHKITSWAGMFAVSQEDFWRIGGYDERFIGWGHEDVALRLALDNEVCKHDRVVDGFAIHLDHPRANATFNTEIELANRRIFRRDYQRKYRWRDERV